MVSFQMVILNGQVLRVRPIEANIGCFQWNASQKKPKIFNLHKLDQPTHITYHVPRVRSSFTKSGLLLVMTELEARVSFRRI